MKQQNPLLIVTWIFAPIATLLVGIKAPTIFLIVVAFIYFLLGLLTWIYPNWNIAIIYRFRKIYSSYIYKSICIKLEYLTKDGSLVSYFRKDHLEILRKKKPKMVLSLAFDGKVMRDRTSSINSSFTFPSKNSVAFECTFDDENIVRNEHYTSYSTCVMDAFKGKEEYWIIKTKRYCNQYTVEVVLPADRQLDDTALFLCENDTQSADAEALKSKNSDWVKVVDPKITLIYHADKTILTAVLADVKPSDTYKVSWIFS